MAITKVFKSGNSQAVRIPREYQLQATEVEIIQRGDELILRPLNRDLRHVPAILAGFSEDFMTEGRAQPPVQTREDL